MNQETNKCDGCKRGLDIRELPINVDGSEYVKVHMEPNNIIVFNCIKDRYTSPTEKKEEKKCCGGLGLFGKCGRGTKTGCKGIHCRCMGKDCTNMHYVDCLEHYIHVEHIETNFKDSSSPTPTDKLSSQSRIEENWSEDLENLVNEFRTDSSMDSIHFHNLVRSVSQESKREVFEKVNEKLKERQEGFYKNYMATKFPIYENGMDWTTDLINDISKFAKEYGIEL